MGNYRLPLMLSRKSRYAIDALAFMAENGATFVQVPHIAAERRIPRKFLENIMSALKKGGILGSKQGRGGGFYFARRPAEISIFQVITVLEGPLSMLPCLAGTVTCQPCESKETCATRAIFADACRSVSVVLNKYTINDIISGNTGATRIAGFPVGGNVAVK